MLEKRQHSSEEEHQALKKVMHVPLLNRLEMELFRRL
jgi:hypothetical protein